MTQHIHTIDYKSIFVFSIIILIINKLEAQCFNKTYKKLYELDFKEKAQAKQFFLSQKCTQDYGISGYVLNISC